MSIWSDYLAPNTLSEFEKQTGIKVHVTSLNSRQGEIGESKEHGSTENAHGIIYMWGTDGIGYNKMMIKALLPDAPLDSWRLAFDPAVASKIAKCGISVLDAPAEMMRAALPYLGRDPNSQKPEDLAAAEKTLMKIRPHIRHINLEYTEMLANGDLCLAVGFNGGLLQARDRAREANRGVEIKYMVPKEGSALWFAMLAIPKDAPNPDSAYAFMDYMMTPRVIGEISNSERFANANAANGTAGEPIGAR